MKQSLKSGANRRKNSKKGKSRTTKGRNKRGNVRKLVWSAFALLAMVIYMVWQDGFSTRPIEEKEIGIPQPSGVHSKPQFEQLLELPQMSGEEKLINYEGFIVCYNSAAKIPQWVAYELQAWETYGEATRGGRKFRPDNALPYPQAEDDDYRNSGWARGHMVPAADFKWSSNAMDDTFYFTNCCPQNSSLNGGMWSTLEKKVRDAARNYGSAWVITGPVTGSGKYGKIGKNRVAVPDAFFKAILVYNGKHYHSIAFVMENGKQKGNMQSCAMSVNELEEITGLNMFEALDNSIEESVEDSYTLSVWNL